MRLLIPDAASPFLTNQTWHDNGAVQWSNSVEVLQLKKT